MHGTERSNSNSFPTQPGQALARTTATVLTHLGRKYRLPRCRASFGRCASPSGES